MRTKLSRNIISIFFISAFLFLRIVDAHAFSHFSNDIDDQTHCELCEIIIVSHKQMPFVNKEVV